MRIEHHLGWASTNTAVRGDQGPCRMWELSYAGHTIDHFEGRLDRHIRAKLAHRRKASCIGRSPSLIIRTTGTTEGQEASFIRGISFTARFRPDPMIWFLSTKTWTESVERSQSWCESLAPPPYSRTRPVPAPLSPARPRLGQSGVPMCGKTRRFRFVRTREFQV